MAMGTSLIHNSTLEYLNLAYNSIDSVGALTLAMGIIENKSSLKKVVLDGNPIGATGAKALLLVPILSETEVELSLDKCNATIKDVKGCWFSFDKIVNTDFELNMENGFDRAVCIFLFNILAGHPSYKISKLTYDSSNRKENKGGGAGRPIPLVPFLSPRSISAFTTKQNALLSALDRVLATASNYQQAMDWFTEIDENGSGNLDLQEFTVLMNKIGMDHLGEKRMAQLFKKYDITNEGTIDLTGFLLLLRQQQMESQERKNEMMFRPLLREKQANENETNGTTGIVGEGNNNNINNNEKFNYYLPPETGIVRITIIDDPLDRKSEENSKYLRIFTSSQCESVIRLVHQMNSSSNHLIDLLSSLLDFARVRYYEAIAFADVMLLETSDKIEVSQKILLSISNSADTAHFLHAIFGDNRQEVMRFKWECGFIIKPLLGSPNGFYSLDLAKELHRKCFFKLLQINAQLAEKRMKFFSGYNSNNTENTTSSSSSSSSHLGDISQKLNFSCFRNEMYNGAPYTIGNQFTTSSNNSTSSSSSAATPATAATTAGVAVVNGVPSSGKIEFDFSTSQRPPKDALPITDKKLLKVLLKHSLLSILDVGVALWKLEEKKERNQLSLACKGTELVENNPERAGNINNHMNDFYSHLEIRSQQLQENRERICRPNTTNNSNNGSFKGGVSSPEEEKEKYSCPKTIRETVLDEISRVEDFFNRRKSKLTGPGGGSTKEARELEKFRNKTLITRVPVVSLITTILLLCLLRL
jgi:Ca2+-binding EF-hand superfamily protein